MVFQNAVAPLAVDPTYRCPCCRYVTLRERGGYEICPVCYWEDDGQDDHDADEVRGGPNDLLSLTSARRNFETFGASLPRHAKHVRPPTAQERAERRAGIEASVSVR